MSNKINDNLIEDIIDDPSKDKTQKYFEQGLITEEERERVNAQLDRESGLNKWAEDVAKCCSPLGL